MSVPSRLPTLYLAGAIRDGVEDDIRWRERVLDACQDLAVFLNPLAGKHFNAETRTWSVSGIPSTARLIVKHDFWCVDRADIVVFNFRALSQKYPNIGTLVEFGRATSRGTILYAIVDPDYSGHENPTMFRLHPFIEENCAAIFDTVEQCVNYLRRELPCLSGARPWYVS